MLERQERGGRAAAAARAYSDAGKAAPTASIAACSFTVFNDYTVFTDDGFLSLPLDLFGWFDTRGAQRVHVGKPFLLLCLLCDGDLEARMRVLFRVFDFNLDGKLDRARRRGDDGRARRGAPADRRAAEQGRRGGRGAREHADEPALPRR